MRLGNSFAINYMSRNNDALWLWFDVQIGRFWYVLTWRKGMRPSLYRSTDATPPEDYKTNEGRWYFGRRSAGRWM